MDATFDLLTLTLLPGVSGRALREIRRRASAAEALANPGRFADLLGDDARRRLADGRAARDATQEADRARRLGLELIGLDEPRYPRLLREIFDPPGVLWVRGRLLPPGDELGVAVVGARAATPAAAAFARTLAADLARRGISVISGLARGIDTAAHRGVLDAGGRTIAVLGSGLDRPYPAENAELAAEVAERGAVVSELPLGSAPRPGHFPRRNRIIAGWSAGVVVVEAGAKSGALITASLALDAGREVMAVPGHPTSPGAAGSNALIRDGARLVRDAADVALELGLEPRAPIAAAGAATGSALLEQLRVDRPATLEELSARSGRPLSELLAELTELELEARVRRLPGQLFLRN